MHVGSYVCVYTRESVWKSDTSRPELARPQPDRPAYCVIAQHYSSASFFSLLLPKGVNSARFKNVIWVVCFLVYLDLQKSEFAYREIAQVGECMYRVSTPSTERTACVRSQPVKCCVAVSVEYCALWERRPRLTIATPSAPCLPLYNEVLADVVVTRHVICSVTTECLDDIQWWAWLGGGGGGEPVTFRWVDCCIALCLHSPCCLAVHSPSLLNDVIGCFHSFIIHSVFCLKKVHTLLQSEFSTEYDLLLRLSISSILSFL